MKQFRRTLVILFLVGVPGVMMSQPSSPSGTPNCWPPPCVPIDGGVSLLIAAGLAIGGKKAYDLRNRE